MWKIHFGESEKYTLEIREILFKNQRNTFKKSEKYREIREILFKNQRNTI